MDRYCVNKDNTKNPGGNHEVHKEGCIWWPSPYNARDLGVFSSCKEAVRSAIQLGYPKVDGCKTCSFECHRG